MNQDTYEDIIKESESIEIKAFLESTTVFASSKGCFGAPFMIVKDSNGKEDCFYGSDRFEQIAMFLSKPYLGYRPFEKQSKL